MRNFKLLLEYDGTSYFGWQVQRNSKKHPTVQGALEKAIAELFGSPLRVAGAGRTDTGVHALGQVAAFQVETRISVEKIRQALNRYLPQDILITDVAEVPLEFHPRFNALKKRYRYVIYNGIYPSVFYRRYVDHCSYALDLDLMNEAARILEGEHDFSHLVDEKEQNKVRIVYKIEIESRKNIIHVDVTGNGFLYKMVRRMVGLLIDVARKKIKLEDVEKILQGKYNGTRVVTAPAQGLTLMEVEY